MAALEILAAETLCRTLLASRIGPEAWTCALEPGPGGRPVLPASEHAVSWSHAGALVACAIVPLPGRIGIDTEPIRPLDLGPLIRVLSEPEARYVQSGSDRAARQRRFLTVWTRKEAYAKARSLGLTLPFRSFSVVESDAHDLLPGLGQFRFEGRLGPGESLIALAGDTDLPASWRAFPFETLTDRAGHRDSGSRGGPGADPEQPREGCQ